MNEYLTNLSSGQPLLWAVFVLGVVAVAALSLSLFWGGLFRAAGMFRRRRADGINRVSTEPGGCPITQK